jgi:hypothetical protein
MNGHTYIYLSVLIGFCCAYAGYVVYGSLLAVIAVPDL